MSPSRRDPDPPEATAEWGWRFHHVGIPTEAVHPGERHLPRFGMHVSGFPCSSYGIEWMRFDADSPLPELIRTVAHVAFEVDDIDAALAGKEILWPPGAPSDGVRSAMIVDNGVPIELISFRR
jgi:hypothetical protein